jgi:hypothetical protein
VFADWITVVAESKDEGEKKGLLLALVEYLKKDRPVESISTVPEHEDPAPSPFLIKTALYLERPEISKARPETNINMDGKTCLEFGETMGLGLWNSRPNLKPNLKSLEDPSSLQEYWDAFPETIRSFFQGLLSTLETKKQTVLNRKRRQRG